MQEGNSMREKKKEEEKNDHEFINNSRNVKQKRKGERSSFNTEKRSQAR